MERRGRPFGGAGTPATRRADTARAATTPPAMRGPKAVRVLSANFIVGYGTRFVRVREPTRSGTPVGTRRI